MPLKKEHLVFGAFVVLFFAVLCYELFFFDPHMAHHKAMHSYMAGRMGPSLLGFNLLFWILIFVFVYFLLRGQSRDDDRNGAITILKERYARGEMTKDEYLEMFKDLKKG